MDCDGQTNMNNKQQSIPRVVSRAFALMDQSFKAKAYISAFLAIGNAAIETVSLLLVFPLILALTNGDLNSLDERLSIVKTAIQKVDPDNPMLATGILIVIAITIKNLAYLAHTWWQLGFVREGCAEFSCRLLERYMANPYLWHLGKNSAELQRNVISCTQTVFNQIIFQTLAFFSEVMVIVGSISALIYMEPVVSLLFFAFITFTSVMYHFAFRQVSLRNGRIMQDAAKNALMAVIQALGAFKEARLLRRERHLIDTFHREVYKQSNAGRTSSMIIQFPRSFLEFCLVLVILFALFWVSSEYDPATGVALIGLFVAAAFRIMPIISRVLAYGQTVKVAIASLEIIEEDLRYRPHGKTNSKEVTHVVRTPDFRQAIEVRNASFTFPDTPNKVLDDVSVTFERGKCFGIVGTTGAGKSTLVDVVMGFIAPDEGQVLVDGVDVSGDARVWGGRLGYVPQAIYLLDDTVRRNIAFGLNDDKIDDARVRACLEKAQLLDFVLALPGGLDNQVGERGVRLSGGQRQRIGIARALYSNPEILILDEGTSALDVETEARLSAAIEELREDKTIILIAHRLSTVKHCDRLILLERGRVVEQGTFEQLAARSEKFKDLIRLANLQSDATRLL